MKTMPMGQLDVSVKMCMSTYLVVISRLQVFFIIAGGNIIVLGSDEYPVEQIHKSLERSLCN